jgi:hypothetical protein
VKKQKRGRGEREMGREIPVDAASMFELRNFVLLSGVMRDAHISFSLSPLLLFSLSFL